MTGRMVDVSPQLLVNETSTNAEVVDSRLTISAVCESVSTNACAWAAPIEHNPINAAAIALRLFPLSRFVVFITALLHFRLFCLKVFCRPVIA